MKRIVTGAVAFAVGAAAWAGLAGAAPSLAASGTMPRCTAATGPVVWMGTGSKTYTTKGAAGYGKGHGTFVCRATAVARGAKAASGGSMDHHSMGDHSMGDHSMGDHSMGDHSMGGSMGGPSMGPARTMAPRPTPSGMPGNMNPASGEQGNTGAPGAGGQVPNNPASTSNSSPSPRPSMRP